MLYLDYAGLLMHNNTTGVKQVMYTRKCMVKFVI